MGVSQAKCIFHSVGSFMAYSWKIFVGVSQATKTSTLSFKNNAWNKWCVQMMLGEKPNKKTNLQVGQKLIQKEEWIILVWKMKVNL